MSKSIAVPDDGGASNTSPPFEPQVTQYQENAAKFLAGFAQLTESFIPKVTGPHPETAPFVRRRLNINRRLIRAALASVEQSPDLQATGALDLALCRNGIQRDEGVMPAVAAVRRWCDAVEFDVQTDLVDVNQQALRLYATAQGLSRNRRKPSLAALVAYMSDAAAFPARSKASTEKAPPSPPTPGGPVQ